jgi:hypothetical protein
MAVQTITEPSADAQQVRLYNTTMRRSNQEGIATGQKFAVCLVKLAAAVNQPDDYAALKTAIEAVTGVQEISLLIDGQCPASIPVGGELRAVVDGHLRIEKEAE